MTSSAADRPMRTLKNKSDIKAIIMIGHANDIIQSKGLFQDGMEFISKPVLSNELLSKGRETLDA